MTYAALQDMRDRIETSELIQLTDEAGNGVIDEAKLTAALNDASDLMDTYIAAHYALPLTSVPAILTQKCVEIARFNLYKNAPPEFVQSRHSAAIEWLKSLAKGAAKLDIAGAEIAPQPDTILTTGNDRVFSRDSLRGL